MEQKLNIWKMKRKMEGDIMYKLTFLKERYPSDYKDENDMIEDLPNPVILGYYYDGSADIECHKTFTDIKKAKNYIKTILDYEVFNLFDDKGDLIMTEDTTENTEKT